jgi:hypothetical protein
MSQLQYIRRTYNVPAFRGIRVRFNYPDAPIEGRIMYARGAYIGVKFDGEKHVRSLHPTWQIEYLHDPAMSPPHMKRCASLREDRDSHDCDCSFMERFAKNPRASTNDDDLPEALEILKRNLVRKDACS